MRRLATIAAMLAVLVGTCTPGTASAADTFRIEGEVDGIYPGFDGVLPALVTNSLDVNVHVTEVSASAASEDPACPDIHVALTTAHPNIDLSPGETTMVPLRIQMTLAAPDACQGVVFDIAFQGTSVADDRTTGALAFTGAPTRADILAIVGVSLLALGILFVRRDQWARAR
jgi:hypothetical protein